MFFKILDKIVWECIPYFRMQRVLLFKINNETVRHSYNCIQTYI